MADVAATPDRDLGTVGTGTPGQKRKRGSDQGSPGSRRSKRGAPAATMSTNESLSANFMDSAEIASAAAAANVNVADFSALQAAANEPHPDTSGDTSNTAAAAAAALDYPNIHMPQPTEEQFAAPAGTESEHPGEATFAADLAHAPDGLLSHPPPPQPASTSVPASVPVVASSSVAQALPTMPSAVSVTPTGASSINQSQQNGYIRPPPSGPRPAVGSEEWHKIRKDNHKEGRHTCNLQRDNGVYIPMLTLWRSGASAPRDNQRRNKRTIQDCPQLREEQGINPPESCRLHHPTERERRAKHRKVDSRKAPDRTSHCRALGVK